VLVWLGGMHFHGAYLSNYNSWLISPKNTLPSAHIVWPIVGQELFNMDLGSYYSGKAISSGLFQLWLSEGILCQSNLKLASSASLIGACICLIGGYFHQHISFLTTSVVRKVSSVCTHHLVILFGLGLMSWAAHAIHIALPINKLLVSGISPSLIPYPHEFLYLCNLTKIFPGFASSVLVDFNVFMPYSGASLLGLQIDPATGSLPLAASAAHHYYLAISFMVAAFLLRNLKLSSPSRTLLIDTTNLGSHLTLTLMLTILSAGSMLFAHHSYAIPVYPFLCIDYTTLFSLFCHHINIGCILILGAGTHASIFLVRDYASSSAIKGLLTEVISHRCILMGHLIYASIFVGLHSFGLYIHNDTIQSLGRPEDLFSDNGLQLKPVFALWIQSLGLINLDLSTLNSKVIAMTQELGTADFMVHHIHAFNIHVTLLILIKGVAYSRTSRLISDKVELGWRYPCDGPGRGGTCQVSPYGPCIPSSLLGL
jgi:photosystem I P700 chlorophyll a apoprotein A1